MLPASGDLQTGAAPARMPRNNFIDDYIFDKMAQDKIPHAGLSSDTEFLRRVTLDLTGRLPQVEDIRKFVKDTDPDKRDKLVDALLGQTLEQRNRCGHAGPLLFRLRQRRTMLALTCGRKSCAP